MVHRCRQEPDPRAVCREGHHQKQRGIRAQLFHQPVHQRIRRIAELQDEGVPLSGEGRCWPPFLHVQAYEDIRVICLKSHIVLGDRHPRPP